MAVLKTYIAESMNERIEAYRKLGEWEASKVADEAVVKFHNKYGLSNTTKTIEDSLDDLTELMRDYLLRKYEQESYCDADYMYLTAPKTKVQNALYNGEFIARSEAGTLSYKWQEIIKNISNCGEGVRAFHRDGKTIKAVRIPLDENSTF